MVPALRRTTLSQEQQDRILRRVFNILRGDYIPHEYHRYARLARRIGFTLSEIPAVEPPNFIVNKYLQYFRAAASKES